MPLLISQVTWFKETAAETGFFLHGATQIDNELLIGNQKLDSALTVEEAITRLRRQLASKPIQWGAVENTFCHLTDKVDLASADPPTVDDILDIIATIRSRRAAAEQEFAKETEYKLSKLERTAKRYTRQLFNAWDQAIAKLEDEGKGGGDDLIDSSNLGQCWANMSGRFVFGIKNTKA